MATLDYIDIPSCATRLDDSTSIQPAQKVLTTLPNPEPPDRNGRQRSGSTSSGSGIPTPMAFIPQMLMGSISTVPATSTAGPSSPTNPRKKVELEKVTVLSTHDPLSLPIMTNNFKRFVAKVGPVFWFQDRVEEILFWKRGWKRTTTWMALYAFLCYFPRTILLIPHAALIGVILCSYPYSSSPSSDIPPIPNQPPAEGTAAWQANLQAIQNLMGFVSDMVTLLQPYTHHLSLSPQHLTSSTSNILPHASSNTRSPYTPHILTLLVVTFFPLLVLIHLPNFPIREVALFGGLAPFVVTHPASHAFIRSLLRYSQHRLPVLAERYEHFITSYVNPSLTKWILHMPLRSTVERLIDNDRLPDEIWHAEMREVELFENERYEGTLSVTESAGQGWSKMNLKSGERYGWTRGRDGWTGVGPDDEISSNLTFSLAPNWRFVPTEDWRRDLAGSWAGCGGADEDGWVYSNDAWLGPRPGPYSAGGGSVTRRRRWVRRVWFDARGVGGRDGGNEKQNM